MLISAFFDHMTPLFLILARVSGLVVTAPFWSSGAISARIKMAIVVMITLSLHFGMGIGAELTGFNLSFAILGLISEILVGAGMGLVMALIFAAIGYAGAIIAPQMGLAISQLMDPQSESMQPLLAAFLNLLAVMFFLAIDGHLMILRSLHDSFRLIPLAGFSVTGGFVKGLLDTGSHMFVVAFKLCSPVLGVIMFLNIGMALLARAVPQVNVIVVGFIVTISVGMLTFLLMLPQAGPFLQDVMMDAVSRMMWLLKTV